jgi:hypothetical protein
MSEFRVKSGRRLDFKDRGEKKAPLLEALREARVRGRGENQCEPG